MASVLEFLVDSLRSEGGAVVIDWAKYHPFVPAVAKPHQDTTRAEARLSFDEAMESRAERRHELAQLLNQWGIKLGSTDDGLQELNDWFCAGVEPDDQDPGRLARRWYAVVNDVGLFLGDTVIERNPGLRWELFVNGKKNVSYHKPVVTGFTKVENPLYHVDYDRLVATIGYRVIGGLPIPPNAFVSWMQAAAERA